MTKLRISADLALPLDAVTQKLGFMGRTGSGKSYAATKTAEQMLEAGAQVVALDPVGVWYGLRIGADGETGFAIPVFGGLHGDIPLAPTAGALVADLIVDRGISCVLDVSQFETNAEKARFALAFAERFFYRKKSAPAAVHLFIEEAQEFVPQNAQPGDQKMLGAFERLIKLGRNFGIGVSLISQRPQEVNKKALEQVECLFAFQMTGTRSRKAIEEWVSSHDVDEARLGDILPELPIGTPHVWSPQWLKISKRIKIAKKRTADVSATPTVGARVREEKPLAAVDLAALQEAMAATIEEAQAEDPKALHRRIRELEAQLAHAGAGVLPERSAVDREIELAVYQEAQRHDREKRVLAREAELALARVRSASEQLAAGVTHLEAAIAGGAEPFVRPAPPDPARSVLHYIAANYAPAARNGSAKAAANAAAASRPATGSDISGPGQRVLDAIAFYESVGVSTPTKAAVAAFCGVSPKTGSWANRLSELRVAGLIADPARDTIALTAAGRAAADQSTIPTTRRELQERWLAKLSGPAAKVLRVLLDAYPDSVDKSALAAHVGVSASTGSWANRLSELRVPGLLEDVSRTEVRAAATLFPRGLR